MKTAKVTRILHSQGLHRSKFVRLTRSARHGLPVRQDQATLTAALGDIRAGREAVQVPVRQALRHRTCGNSGARHRLDARWKRNQWAADACRQRPLRRSRPGGPARVTHPLVLEPGAYPGPAGLGRAWVQLQGQALPARLALPLPGIHRPTGSLWLLRRDDGQVSRHYALDADVVGGTDVLGVTLSDSAAHADSAGARHGKGKQRNPRRTVAQKHRADGRSKPADPSRRHNLGHRQWNRRPDRHEVQVRDCLGPAVPHTVVQGPPPRCGTGVDDLPPTRRQAPPARASCRARGAGCGCTAWTELYRPCRAVKRRLRARSN